MQTWSDPRYFLTAFIMPLGFLVWAGMTVCFAIFPFYYIQRAISSETNKIVTVVIFAIGFFGCSLLHHRWLPNFSPRTRGEVHCS